jgi:hypothetical protein
MHEGARIFVHDRATYKLSQITVKSDPAQSKARAEAHYAEFLLRLLMRATRTSIEITSGATGPDLTELINDPTDREWASKLFSIEREKLDADSIIDRFLQRAGWRWYKLFKTKGVLRSPVQMRNGRTMDWHFNLTLRKDSAGRRELVIER